MTFDFRPSRAAGLARLSAIAHRLGQPYATGRNTHPGALGKGATSHLSPWLRRRLVLEAEAVVAARQEAGDAAEKFIEEVYWRTYWKGYLEQHPSIWDAFRRALAAAEHRIAAEAGLRRVFHDATEGQTGIDGFDAWAQQLVAQNWLHNHARMWFASIWIFTLRLPWALGAAFFLRHLLDGDPASNTLSWRWVAGLHTRGKHYVARAENIARYTDGQFNPHGALDEAPEPLVETDDHPTAPLPEVPPAPQGDVAMLLHDDDLCPELLDLRGMRVRAVAAFSAWDELLTSGVAEHVLNFSEAAVADVLVRAGGGVRLAPGDVAGWVAASPWPVVTPYAPVGPVASRLQGLPVTRLLRPWDAAAWPHARRGFFQLRAQIAHLEERALQQFALAGR